MGDPVVVLVGHCRDCRWWDRDEGYSYPDDWHGCQLTTMGNPMQAHESLAYNGWDNGSVRTSPDFGCVQFAYKDEDAPINHHDTAGINLSTSGTVTLQDTNGLGWHDAKGGR